MKKFLALLLCLLLLGTTLSCERQNPTPDGTGDPTDENSVEETTTGGGSDEETTAGTATDEVNEWKNFALLEDPTIAFVSAEERAEWRDKIVAVLSSDSCAELVDFWYIGAALMDLDLDGTPEVILANKGGSMGNVCIMAYDLNSGERTARLGDTPHDFENLYNAYFCVHQDPQGGYVILNLGLLRNGLEGYTIMSRLTDTFMFDVLFEVVRCEDSIRFVWDGETVDATEFETRRTQLQSTYKKLAQTEMQIILWDSLDVGDGENTRAQRIAAMADALIASDQQFLDLCK